MKTLTLRPTFQKAWCLALFATLLLASSGVRGQDDQDGLQPHRFLLVFETSTTVKKNLPAIQEMLAKLFADNLSNQLRPDDDIAVWTVDEELHDPSEFSASWIPEDAAAYTDSLCAFLSKQKYSRHASIAPIQPALDRIAKSSQHLTVLIFCDTQSRLIGTPYDFSVNEIITNTAAGAKSPFPLILVLRSYRGEFIGSSVNRSESLVYPKFPTPPKPAPPVAHNPVPPLAVPIVTQIPAMIIVGTNAGTNISILTNTPPPPPHSPSSAAKAAPAATTAATTAAPASALPTVTAQSPPPAPAPLPTTAAPPNPPPAPRPQAAPAAPATMAKQPVPVAPAPPVATQSNTVAAVAVQTPSGNKPSGNNYFLLLALGIGALALALVIAVRSIVRSRRPTSSLITSSMIEDPRHPPQN